MLLGVCASLAVRLGLFDGKEPSPNGPENRTVIVIAKFSERGASDYNLTDQLVSKLRSGLREYDDMELHALDRMVSEQEGSDLAHGSLSSKLYASLHLCKRNLNSFYFRFKLPESMQRYQSGCFYQ
jgi:hypothetical protein